MVKKTLIKTIKKESSVNVDADILDNKENASPSFEDDISDQDAKLNDLFNEVDLSDKSETPKESERGDDSNDYSETDQTGVSGENGESVSLVNKESSSLGDDNESDDDLPDINSEVDALLNGDISGLESLGIEGEGVEELSSLDVSVDTENHTVGKEGDVDDSIVDGGSPGDADALMAEEVLTDKVKDSGIDDLVRGDNSGLDLSDVGNEGVEELNSLDVSVDTENHTVGKEGDVDDSTVDDDSPSDALMNEKELSDNIVSSDESLFGGIGPENQTEELDDISIGDDEIKSLLGPSGDDLNGEGWDAPSVDKSVLGKDDWDPSDDDLNNKDFGGSDFDEPVLSEDGWGSPTADVQDTKEHDEWWQDGGSKGSDDQKLNNKDDLGLGEETKSEMVDYDFSESINNLSPKSEKNKKPKNKKMEIELEDSEVNDQSSIKEDGTKANIGNKTLNGRGGFSQSLSMGVVLSVAVASALWSGYSYFSLKSEVGRVNMDLSQSVMLATKDLNKKINDKDLWVESEIRKISSSFERQEELINTIDGRSKEAMNAVEPINIGLSDNLKLINKLQAGIEELEVMVYDKSAAPEVNAKIDKLKSALVGLKLIIDRNQESMGAEVDSLSKNLSTYKSELSSVKSEISNVRVGYEEDFKTVLKVTDEILTNQKERSVNLGPESTAGDKETVASVLGIDVSKGVELPTYTYRAIVNNALFLIMPNKNGAGKLLKYVKGDNLEGYGEIKSINAETKIVMTESGPVSLVKGGL